MSGTVTSGSTAANTVSFTEKQINITLGLGTGTFDGTSSNTVKLSGLRCVVSITKGGYPGFDRAEAQVWGVPPSIMNAVSSLGVPMINQGANNTMLIEAGDTTNGIAVIYSGALFRAWQNFDDMPDTFLELLGNTGYKEALASAAPLSFTGSGDVATIMSGIAQQQGWAFENSGVTVKLAASYFPGTIISQVHAIARAANIECYIDSGTDPFTLAIWPKTGTRGGAQPLINAANGLIGYPKYMGFAIGFRCLYNPNIRIGKTIMMQSTLSSLVAGNGSSQGGPNGTWYVVGPLSHSLSAQVPGGPWFTDAVCARTNGPPVS